MNVRLNTGLRAPTGYRGGQVSSKLLESKALKLCERPVTQQGISGLKSQLSGPKRKVFDKSYYVQAIKKKNERLTQEIAKLRQKKEKRKEEDAVRAKLEERKKQLNTEVRSLEAKLADLNLAMDKHRAGTHKGDLVRDRKTELGS
jgi:chromosome segregation ATPase